MGTRPSGVKGAGGMLGRTPTRYSNEGSAGLFLEEPKNSTRGGRHPEHRAGGRELLTVHTIFKNMPFCAKPGTGDLPDEPTIILKARYNEDTSQ